MAIAKEVNFKFTKLIADDKIEPFWTTNASLISNMLYIPSNTDFETKAIRLGTNSWFNTKQYDFSSQLTNENKDFIYKLKSLLPTLMRNEHQDAEPKDLYNKVLKEFTSTEQFRNRVLTEKYKNFMTEYVLKDVMQIALSYEQINEYKTNIVQWNNQIKTLKYKKDIKPIELNIIKAHKNIIKCQKYIAKLRATEVDDSNIPNFIEEKEQAEKAIKYRIFPTKSQRETLSKWFGVRRYIYNKVLYYIRNLDQVKFKMPSKKELRAKFINNNNYENVDKWVLDYDYDLKDEALQDLLKNYKSAIAKFKKDKKPFKIKYISKKDDSKQSISVLAKKWNISGFYSQIFNSKLLRCEKELPDKLPATSRIIRTKTNKYYICIPLPLDKTKKISPPITNKKAIFLDPGTKHFLTGYDIDGKVITLGDFDVARIGRLIHHRNKLHSKINKDKTIRHKQRYKMKIALLRLNEKIGNLVDDYHKKITKWLCTNYNYIFLPRLNFHKIKKMTKREKAKLVAFRHCDLVNRIINKTREYTNCRLIEPNESFTSKTCCKCVTIKEDLKNANVHNCSNCKASILRDMTGCVNIMLRYLTKRANIIVSMKEREPLTTLLPEPHSTEQNSFNAIKICLK